MTSISHNELFENVEISEQDVYAAMQLVPGYIDITTGDFLEIFRLANDHAKQRIFGRIRAGDLTHEVRAPLTPNLTLDEAIRRMTNQGLTRIPVVNEHDHVVGILSDRDVLRHLGFESVLRLLAGISEGSSGFVERCRDVQVAAVMISPVATLGDDARYDEIAEAFRAEGSGSMAVVDENDRLRGMLERTVFSRTCLEESDRQEGTSMK